MKVKSATITCSASTEVAVARRALFDLLNDDERFFDLRPGAVEHRDIEPLPRGGHSCTQVYEMNGRTIELRCRTSEFQPPLRFVDEVEAPDQRATVTTTLEDLGSTTRLLIHQEVTLRKAAGMIRRRALRADAERRVAAALDAIKRVAEATSL